MSKAHVDVDVGVEAFHTYLLGMRAKNTADKYAASAASFLKLMQANGYKRFSEMPPGLLNDFSSLLRREGSSPGTVKVYVYAVKKYLEWVRGKGIAVQEQLKVDLRGVKTEVRPALPPERISEFFQLADALLEEPLRTAVMLLPCCGLRASEIVSLNLGNIQRATIKMAKKKNGKDVYKKTFYLVTKGKGDKTRNVPLMDEGVEILIGYLTGWRKHGVGPWLFPTSLNRGKKHITDRALRSAMQKIRAHMGLKMTPHTMRRTYVTTLWRKGVDLKVLSAVIGHANIQTTIDHYIAMEPDDALRAFHAAGGTLT